MTITDEELRNLNGSMDEKSMGTFDCPICGFDKPHHHDAAEIAIRDTANEAQRAGMRAAAADRHAVAELKNQFDAGPREYVRRYGSINSIESAPLVPWLLERIDAQSARLREARRILEARHVVCAACGSGEGCTVCAWLKDNDDE